MNNPNFKALVDINGRSEFENFLNSLSDKDFAKTLYTIESIENEGILIAINMQWVKKLRDDIFEIRIKQGSNIQRVLYFHKIENNYIITHGFTKKTDKVPPKEIRKALKLKEKYESGELYEFDFKSY